MDTERDHDDFMLHVIFPGPAFVVLTLRVYSWPKKRVDGALEKIHFPGSNTLTAHWSLGI